MDGDVSLPPALERLLAELEAPSPSIQEFGVDLTEDEYEGFFKYSWDESEDHGARARVRQRVLQAIGNCISLRTIHLNLLRDGRVTEEEAGAFFQALQESNHVLEELDVSWCKGFGSAVACVALARLLRTSRTLTKLNLRNVELTGEGLGDIAAALRAPDACRLQELNVSSNNIGRGAPGGGARHLADIITHTPTLRSLLMHNIGMDMAGGEMIANALTTNPSLEELAVGWWGWWEPPAVIRILRALTPPVTQAGPGGSQDHSAIQTALRTPSVKSLSLIVIDPDAVNEFSIAEVGEALACMLSSNTCLQTLSTSTIFIGYGLQALTDSTSITALELSDSGEHYKHFRKLTSIVLGCKQLQSLTLGIDIPGKEKRRIFQALKDNPNIKRLVIDGWTGLDDDMFKVLMTSLQVNTSLETISMMNTEWDREGKMTIVDELLKRKMRQVAYLDRLHHGSMKFNHPQVGRLFLCGSAFAGKTTLRTRLIHSHSSLYKRLLKEIRTEGIEVEILIDSDTMQVSIWDLAGQDEYRALQSFLFPSINQACIFFFVFSLYDEQTCALKTEDDLTEELHHWLRFIASNTLPGNDVLPQVVVVLTHLDKMPHGTGAEVMMAWATPAVTKLKARYDGLLNISPHILVVNANSRRSIAPVRQAVVVLFRELFEKLKLVPEACTRMTAVLAKWKSRNSKWPIMRLSSFNDLCFESVEELHKFNKQDDQAISILQAIASYLHDVGVIMFFQNLEIVVVDPNWISHVFLGRLMRSQGTTGATSSNVLPSSSDGFVPEVALQTALRCFLDKKNHRGFDEKDMINLMLELKLCYQEQDPGALGVTSYFVPNTLIDVTGKALHGLRQLEWPLGVDGPILRHMGRRLQCKDKICTYLDPGFFPRFQVILQNRLFAARPEMRPKQYRNELNLIAFHTDGIEVFVEMPGDVGDLIDILVRSRKTPEQTRAFVVTHVLDEIRSFCASSQGSQGVELVEGVIRPDCVTNLTLCKHRRDQAVLKSELMGHLLGEHVSNESCGPIFTPLEHLDYQHTWNKVDFDGAGLPACAERADGLLDPEDMFEVLNRKERSVEQRLTMVEDAAKQVLCQAHGGDDSDKVEVRVLENRLHTRFGYTMSDLGSTHRTSPNFHRLLLDIQQIKHALGKMDEKLDVIVSLQKQMVEKVQALQEETLATVASKMDEILNFSVELEKSDVPRRPYFTTDDVGTSQKLVAGIQMCKAMTLHFMCEDPQGNHMVSGQVGLPLTVEIAKWNSIRPILLQSAKMLVFLVKAGLHVAAGIGSAVPDFASWTGAVPLTAAGLAGESLLNNINTEFPEAVALKQSKCVEEAWMFLKEELKPQLDAGQMGKLFKLYKGRILGGHHDQRGVAWLCRECMSRGIRKGVVDRL